MRTDVLAFMAVLLLAILFAALYHPSGEKSSHEAPAVEKSADDTGGPALKGDVSRGREIATGLCGGCHAIPPATVSPQPPAPPFAEVAGRWPPDDLAEALAEGIVVGHEGHVIMPEFSFNPQQIEDLLAYMQSLRK